MYAIHALIRVVLLVGKGDCLLVERDAEAGARRVLMISWRDAHRDTETSAGRRNFTAEAGLYFTVRSFASPKSY